MIAEINQEFPFWAAFVIVSPPLIGFLFFQPDELRRSVVQFVQIAVAVWYFVVAAVLVALVYQMPQPWPDWWPLFLAGVAIGAIPCIVVIYRFSISLLADDSTGGAN